MERVESEKKRRRKKKNNYGKIAFVNFLILFLKSDSFAAAVFTISIRRRILK
jgi:hypothetical protein